MSSRRRAVRILGIAQAALLVPLLECERRMRRAGGPGIIPFELAGPDGAKKIMRKWGGEGQRAARVSLALDYPFLVTYSGLQLIGCTAVSEAFDRQGAGRLAAAGRVIGPAQIAAGAFDSVENTALLLTLAGRGDPFPAVARASALAKFALLAAGWGYLKLGLLNRLLGRFG
jgi:hypothetical protein